MAGNAKTAIMANRSVSGRLLLNLIDWHDHQQFGFVGDGKSTAVGSVRYLLRGFGPTREVLPSRLESSGGDYRST
jgi:hypothetical protein